MRITLNFLASAIAIILLGNVFIASAAVAPVPKTGQIKSYVATGGEDGDLQLGVAWPNPRFTDNGDGTVKDNLTGLIWLKDAGALGQMNWETALTNCAAVSNGMYGLTDGSVAGDWRLPNLLELRSLIRYDSHGPAVSDTTGTGQWTAGDPFTNIQSLQYWSSTTYASSTGNAYIWYALYGGTETAGKNNSYYVWPVRGTSSVTNIAPIPKTGQTTSYTATGGEDGDLQLGVAWPNPRFTDNGDGTILDNLTELVWLKDASALGQLNWETALTTCATISNGVYGLTDKSSAGDWRLPNANEIISLVHFGYSIPVIPDTAGTGQWTEGNPFTGVKSDKYFSSTTYKAATGNAYYLHAWSGALVTVNKSTACYVWPVRDYVAPPRGTVISIK